ncbi:MAG: hypothetical protein IT374_13530 [Polyangiaceae bacterium]|nr:hypothetical protein [Polyangiaceae bacterium]
MRSCSLGLACAAAVLASSLLAPPLLAAPGAGACDVSFSKLDYDQVGADDGAREVVELVAPGATPGQTLGECGITRLVPWDGDACAPEAASRAIELVSVVVPPSRRIVLARAGAAVSADARSSTKSGAWLENGPDLLVLEGSDGPLAALTYGGPTSCAPAALSTSAGVDAATSSAVEQWLVACDDGWRKLPRDDAGLGAPVTCPAGAAAGAGGATGAGGGAGAAGSSGAAGAGQPARTCAARLSKIDVTQPDGDAAEGLELEIVGEPAPGAVVRDCGVERVEWINANTETGGCGALAGTYLEVRVGGLPVPPSRRVVVGNLPGADQPLGAASARDAVQPGPDYVALVGADGELRDAVMYASERGATASCDVTATAAPADPTAPTNRVLVRCEGGDVPRWLAAPEHAVTWRAPVNCPRDGWPEDPPAAPSPSAPAPSASAPSARPVSAARAARGIDEDPAASCAISRPSGGAWPLALAAACLTRRRPRARARQAQGTARRAPSAPPRRA